MTQSLEAWYKLRLSSFLLKHTLAAAGVQDKYARRQ